jgi:UDP-glucuronate 4-epimerase
MALWLFTEKMLRGEPIQVFNNGNMWRDFTYIDDIVAGIVGVIDATIAGSIAGCQIYNIGNDQSEKLMDLIGILERELGVKAKMELMPMQDGDVLKTHADISRLQKAVGYAPTTPISEGIPKFVKWYRDEWLPAIK